MTNLPLNTHLQSSVEKAKKLALQLGRNGVDPELLFYIMLTFPSFSCASIFERSEIDFDELQGLCYADLANRKPAKTPSDHLTARTKEMFVIAEQFCAVSFGTDYISPEIFFLCFFSEKFLPKCLKSFLKIKSEHEIVELDATKKFFELTAIHAKDLEEILDEGGDEDFEDEDDEEEYADMFHDNPVLSQFAENLNLQAAKGEFDGFVDFDNKVDELAAILCRKKKPNAILVGGAGTGKTGLVCSLALKIVQGDAPELLANKVIYSLNLSSMVAGTMYRGQFEERLKKFVEEIKKYKNIILFIDEIHTLIGAGGGSSSSLEASNILKPELARGTISCIGATTVNEYTETIKKDSALDRRFERVIIREPSKFIMQQILPEIITHYEDFHGVKYSPEFVKNVVGFCERFLPNKFYPDKAVTVIDHCGAQAKVNFWETDPLVKESQQKILAQIDEKGEVPPELFEELNKKLELWQEKLTKEEPVVNLSHLKDFFEKRRNPLSSLKTCKNIAEFVRSEFVGQRKPIKEFFDTLSKVSMGLGKKNSAASPDSYLFYGGKSVGKTLLAKTMKDALEKNGASVIYFSGIQLADQTARYKILSDYNKNSSLCEKVVMNPNSVIIIDDFDEIDFSCIDLFSQILKEGRIQMNNGDVADFSNCKFLFTCKASDYTSMGFNSENEKVTPKLTKKLSELVEKTLLLGPPSKKDLRRIVFNRLNDVKENLAYQDVSFSFSFKTIKDLVDKSACKENCVAVINAAIESDIIAPISEKVLSGEVVVGF